MYIVKKIFIYPYFTPYFFTFGNAIGGPCFGPSGQDEVPPSPPPPRAAAELGSGGAGPTEFANPEDETQPGQLHGVESLDESRKSHMTGGQSVDEHPAPSPMKPVPPPGHLETIFGTPSSQVDGLGCLNARDGGYPNFKRPADDVDLPMMLMTQNFTLPCQYHRRF